MSEELGGLDDIGWWEWWREVSEAELTRVRETAKKAAAAGQKKNQQAQRDNQNAKLLSLLLKYINSEKLLHHISHQLVDMKIDPVVIVWEFLPILKQHISIEALKPLYDDLWNEIHACNCASALEILDWYQIVFKSYDELQDISNEDKVTLVTDWCTSFGYNEVEVWDWKVIWISDWIRKNL